jgi:hypothetical protein
MAIQSLATIKLWFRTALKPSQAQFWDTWDSFWHKNDAIPTSAVYGLDALLVSKATHAEVAALSDEVADLTALCNTLATIDYVDGLFAIQKAEWLDFTFNDVADVMVYTLDLLAEVPYNINSLVLVCDAGTVTVDVAIAGVPVTGCAGVVATTTTAATRAAATGARSVAVDNRVTLTVTGITGEPTTLIGKMNFIRA